MKPRQALTMAAFLAAILATLLLMLIPYGQAFGEETLTMSPFSFTLHGVTDEVARDEFAYTPLDDTTTFHPGASLLYKDSDANLQLGAFYFLDSFGNHAGGVLGGPSWDFLDNYVGVGLVGGIYVREKVPGTLNGFPISLKTAGVEIAPLAAITGSVSVPISDNISIEVNSASNYLINNVQLGVRFGL